MDERKTVTLVRSILGS